VTNFAVKVLRTVSIGLCLVAILSFLMFALNQTSTASGHQQEELSGRTVQKHAGENTFHRTVDEISEKTTAPVSGLSSSQWGEHALRLIFALLVFGFVLGYLARVLRVRT
jgi:H+/Cl- antiporter ClcA